MSSSKPAKMAGLATLHQPGAPSAATAPPPHGAPASAAAIPRRTPNGRPGGEILHFGYIPNDIIAGLHDEGDWKPRAAAIERLQVLTARVEDWRPALPHVLPLLDFLCSLLLDDPNFKIALTTLHILDDLVEKLGGAAMRPCVGRLVPALLQKFADNKIVIRQANVQVLTHLMGAMTPKPVLKVCTRFLGHENSRVREETVNLIIVALLTFKRYEFDYPTLVAELVTSLRDQKAKVKYVAVEAYAVIGKMIGHDRVTRMLKDYGVEDSILEMLNIRFENAMIPMLTMDGLVEHILTRTVGTPRPASSRISAASDRMTAQRGAVYVGSLESDGARYNVLGNGRMPLKSAPAPLGHGINGYLLREEANDGQVYVGGRTASQPLDGNGDIARRFRSAGSVPALKMDGLPWEQKTTNRVFGSSYYAQHELPADLPMHMTPAYFQVCAPVTSGRGDDARGQADLFSLQRSRDRQQQLCPGRCAPTQRSSTTQSCSARYAANYEPSFPAYEAGPAPDAVAGAFEDAGRAYYHLTHHARSFSAPFAEPHDSAERTPAAAPFREEYRRPPDARCGDHQRVAEWGPGARARDSRSDAVSNLQVGKKHPCSLPPSPNAAHFAARGPFGSEHHEVFERCAGESTGAQLVHPCSAPSHKVRGPDADGRDECRAPLSKSAKDKITQCRRNIVSVSSAPPAANGDGADGKTTPQAAKQSPAEAFERAKVRRRKALMKLDASSHSAADGGPPGSAEEQCAGGDRHRRPRSFARTVPQEVTPAAGSPGDGSAKAGAFDPGDASAESDVRATVQQLRSLGDWTEAISALTRLQGLLSSPAAVSAMIPRLPEIVVAVSNEVGNLRSGVAKVAISVLGDVCAAVGKSVDPHADAVAAALVKKIGEGNSFLCEESGRALATLCRSASFARATNALAAHADNRSPAVRCRVSRCLADMVTGLSEQTAARYVAHRDFERLLPVVVRLTRDGMADTRFEARRALTFFKSVPGFHRTAQKILSPSQMTDLNEARETWASDPNSSGGLSATK